MVVVEAVAVVALAVAAMMAVKAEVARAVVVKAAVTVRVVAVEAVAVVRQSSANQWSASQGGDAHREGRQRTRRKRECRRHGNLREHAQSGRNPRQHRGGPAERRHSNAAAADAAAGDGSLVERAHARPAHRRLVAADEGPPPQARCERAGARTGQPQMPLLLGVSSTADRRRQQQRSAIRKELRSRRASAPADLLAVDAERGHGAWPRKKSQSSESIGHSAWTLS